MTYVGVKCLTRHRSVLRDTLTRGENHGIYEDSTCIFPDSLKIARITPIYKSEDATNM